MLSAKSLFQEILDDDESFRLFCSIAASGESQGGWENGRIAALVPPGERELAPKITRHGADEDKHGRIFNALLKKRGLEPVAVPPETDYTMLLERHGIGLAHDKLRRDEPLTEQDIVTYLAHSRVTEQRASEQMELLRKHFADHPDLGRAVRMISHDEDNHLAYCHEELLRFAARRTRPRPSSGPCASARSPRSASTGTSASPSWPTWGASWAGRAPSRRCSPPASTPCTRTSGSAAGGGWCRLRMPERRDALGGPAATAAPEFA